MRIIINFIDKLLKGGEVLMATSSIFTNVKITDRHSAETFISALEKVSKSPQRVPTAKLMHLLEIKKLLELCLQKG